MPDSGATCSITDIKNVMEWNIPMVTVNPEDFQVTTVTGQAINIVGRSSITIHKDEQGQYDLHFLVAEEIIVGW